MQIVGLTGGIASGKSTVTTMFAELGARTLSADDDARAVLAAGSPLLNAVSEAFPDAVASDGAIDRSRLAATIFESPEARARLEAIMHPAIEERMKRAIHAARADEAEGALVYEVPLLYEAHLEDLFDRVVVVTATRDQQHERLQSRERRAGRPPLSDSDIAERLAAQSPSHVKAARADHIIDNSGALDETRAQVRAVWTAVIGE